MLVESEVGGDEVSSPDTTVMEDDSMNNPTVADTTEAENRSEEAGGGDPINTARAFAGVIRREEAAVDSRRKTMFGTSTTHREKIRPEIAWQEGDTSVHSSPCRADSFNGRQHRPQQPPQGEGPAGNECFHVEGVPSVVG